MQYGRSSMGGLTQRRAQAPVQTPAHSQRQRGVALVVVLLFLVAITGISVWTVRQSMLAEGMARNQMDQEVARQAAESALRDAERDIDTASLGQLPDNASCQRNPAPADSVGLNPAEFKADCSGGLCLKDDASYAVTNWATADASNQSVAEPWWPTGKGGLWNDDPDEKPVRVPATAGNCDFTGGVPMGINVVTTDNKALVFMEIGETGKYPDELKAIRATMRSDAADEQKLLDTLK